MTEQESIIVSAYTGYLLCDFSKVHKYVEEKLGRPIWTHEFASDELFKEIQDKCRDDFVGLRDEQRESNLINKDTVIEKINKYKKLAIPRWDERSTDVYLGATLLSKLLEEIEQM